MMEGPLNEIEKKIIDGIIKESGVFNPQYIICQSSNFANPYSYFKEVRKHHNPGKNFKKSEQILNDLSKAVRDLIKDIRLGENDRKLNFGLDERLSKCGCTVEYLQNVHEYLAKSLILLNHFPDDIDSTTLAIFIRLSRYPVPDPGLEQDKDLISFVEKYDLKSSSVRQQAHKRKKHINGKSIATAEIQSLFNWANNDQNLKNRIIRLYSENDQVIPPELN